MNIINLQIHTTYGYNVRYLYWNYSSARIVPKTKSKSGAELFLIKKVPKPCQKANAPELRLGWCWSHIEIYMIHAAYHWQWKKWWPHCEISSSRCIELADPFSPDAIVTARISSKSRQKGEEISITPRAFPKVTMSLPMNLTTTERSRIGDSWQA